MGQEIFLFSLFIQESPGSLSLFYNVYWNMKRSGRGVYNPTHLAVVKHAWIYTSTPNPCVMAFHI